MTFYGVEYSFGQFKSLVLAVLPPSFFSPCTSSLAENDTQESPWCRINRLGNNQDMSVLPTLFLCWQSTTQYCASYWEEINYIPAKTRTHWCLFKSDCVLMLYSDSSLCPFILANITLIHCFGYLFRVLKIFFIGHPQQK